MVIKEVKILNAPIMLVSNHVDPLRKRAPKDGSGEHSTIFLYLRRISVAQSDWLNAFICTGFPHHPLIIPFQSYSPHLQFTGAKQATSKA